MHYTGKCDQEKLCNCYRIWENIIFSTHGKNFYCSNFQNNKYQRICKSIAHLHYWSGRIDPDGAPMPHYFTVTNWSMSLWPQTLAVLLCNNFLDFSSLPRGCLNEPESCLVFWAMTIQIKCLRSKWSRGGKLTKCWLWQIWGNMSTKSKIHKW